MSQARYPRRFLCALVVAGLSASAGAGSVRILERPNVPPFPTIQAGVDAALDGETLLVSAGTYASFSISAKSLAVFNDSAAAVTVNGMVTVQDLPNPGTVVLSGLAINGPTVTFGTPPPGLKLLNDAGHVRVEACAIRGGWIGQNDDYRGGAGADVTGCPQVVFVACSLFGSDAGWCPGCMPGVAGNGVTAINSGVTLYDCTLLGGKGTEETTPGGNGGHGYFGSSWGVVASGCAFGGGSGGGGDYIGCWLSGGGGDGMRIVNAQAHLLDNTFSGGPPGPPLCGLGPPGQGINNQNSTLDVLAGARRKLTAPATTSATLPLAATLTGQAGDRVFVLATRAPFFLFMKVFHGTWCVPLPTFFMGVPSAVLGSSGTANLSLRAPKLLPSEIGKLFFYQALIIDAAGQHYLSSPQHVLVLSWPTLVWVDASAPPGGNGSSSLPFQSLRAAFDVCVSGSTVMVRDGLYNGAANRDLDFGGREITVKGVNGPANCVIDCEQLGRAFTIGAGATLASRIEGLTIRNGRANSGGAISAFAGSAPGSVTVWDCVIESCATTSNNKFGGAICAGWVDIRRCSFRSNWNAPFSSTTTGGAIGLSVNTGGGPVSRIQDCDFDDNRGSWGGAIAAIGFFSGQSSEIVIAHCRFSANQAAVGGGAVYASLGQGATLGTRIDDCLFAGNTAVMYGGAVSADKSSPGAAVWITSSTFTANSTGGFGGALSFQRSITASVNNCVLWGDSAATGNEISLRAATPSATVAYCDVQGGQAGVEVLAGTLTWGSGNLSVDPLFADPDGADNNPLTFGDNDYTLALASPCIDAGDNSLIAADFLDIDGDGNTGEPVPLDLLLNPRRADVPSAPNTGNGTSPLVDIGAYERP